MDFLKHVPKIAVNNNKLENWLANELNVLLVGSHGVGKTSMILEVFKEKLGTKWAFYNGATTDPWTDLIGIPAINKSNGKETIKYIRPEDLNDDIEAIYVDELNRAKTATRNALLELIQFKSINGRKFPKLKVVWASINPPKDEDEEADYIYDVEVLDPAQVDRFHIIVRLQESPSLAYFSKKYDLIGRNLVDWWGKQSDLTKKLLTPRRLEYVAQVYKKGIDIADVLPICANISMLKQTIDQDPISQKFIKLTEKNLVTTALTAFLQKESHVEAAIPIITAKKSWHLISAFPKEIQASLIAKHADEVVKYAIGSKDIPILEQLLLLYKSNPTYSVEIKKIEGIFNEAQKTTISNTMPLTGSEEKLLEIVKTGNKQLPRLQTHYRRKLVEKIRQEFPKKLTNNDLIDELDIFLKLWARRTQGNSIARYVALMVLHEKNALNGYDEIQLTYYTEVGTCIGIALAMLELHPTKYIRRDWYEKMERNGVQFLGTSSSRILKPSLPYEIQVR